jgi:hypothetical protein
LRRIDSEGKVRTIRLCLLRCGLLGSGLLRCGSLLGGSPLLGRDLGCDRLRRLCLGDTTRLCLSENACDLLLNGRGGAGGGSGGGLAGLAGVRLGLSSSSGLLCGGLLRGGSLLGRRLLFSLGCGGLSLLEAVLATVVSWQRSRAYGGSSLRSSLGLSSLGSSLSLGGSRLLLLLLLLGLGLLGGSRLSLLLCELHGTGST